MAIRKLLIANRGEIAVRIIRTCSEMGILTVAVYSEADKEALHVKLADEAVLLGPPEPSESYLSIQRLLDATRSSGADAIHPGYGFLSERAEFSDACKAAGIVFVGPSGDAMRRLGDEIRRRVSPGKGTCRSCPASSKQPLRRTTCFKLPTRSVSP